MINPSVVILPSPLVGPASYRPLARALSERGFEAQVSPLPDTPPHAADILLCYVTRAEAASADIVIAHSNAGYYLPAVVESVGASVSIAMDAALPASDTRRTAISPPDAEPFLRSLADDDGVLPPWTRWWPLEDVSALFPDAAALATVQDDEPRLPLAYFNSDLPVPPRWTETPSAYLAFGGAYADELDRARACGWATDTLPGSHFHHVWAPESVAETIHLLCDQVRLEGTPA